jgi:hypothetical protein
VTPVTAPISSAVIAPPSADSGDSLDDADALPAVGKVWDDGPKRSLGEILASASRQRQVAAPAIQPTQRASIPGTMGSDLAAIWSAGLQQVQDELGAAVHVPLVAGQPTRDGDRLVIHFTGAFAAMSKYLDKHRDEIQRIFSTVAGEALLVQFQADESPVASSSASQPSHALRQPLPPRSPAENLTTSAAAVPRDGIPLTPELRAQLEKDPLIRGIMEAFNGNIVKVEE